MPHPNKSPPAEAVSRSRTFIGWLPLAALALVAPVVAWILLPGDTSGNQPSSSTATAETATPDQGVWSFGSRRSTAAPAVDTYTGGGSTASPGQPAAAGQAVTSGVDAGTASARQMEVTATEPSAADASLAGVATGSAADETSRASAGPVAGADTLFLTIVGDQTFTSWGRAGDRPPPVDGMTAAAGGAGTTATDQLDDGSGPGSSGGSALEEAVADAGGAVENPLGEAPQVCPRTLPPGSNQSTADALRNQYSCRYLSGCDVLTQQCTWFYQGQG